MSNSTNTGTSVSKGALEGAAWGTAFATGSALIGVNRIKKGIKALGTKDTFEKINPLEHISRDTINNIDTYSLKGTKISFNTPIGTNINFDSASEALQNGLKEVRKNAPKSILKNAALMSGIFAGCALLSELLNKRTVHQKKVNNKE